VQISIQRKALLQEHERSAANIAAKAYKNICMHGIENILTIGRNIFPSTPILKKYSAAEASLGTCYIISYSHHELELIFKQQMTQD